MNSEPSASRNSSLFVGTSGFSYDDWVGPYYPKNIPKARWFDFYAEEFSCIEINASYYSWMSTKAMESLSSRAPVDFRFAVKLHRSITHGKEDLQKAIEATIEQNLPLEDPVHLAQFPNGFKPSDEAWEKIEGVADLENVVVEFRNKEWQTDETLTRLRKLGISLCAVDVPAVQGLPKFSKEITGDIAYIRLHGRNAAKWYDHDHAFERYDYLYSDKELTKIAEDISEMSERAEESFVFFNNHYAAQAVTNARQLGQMLGIGTEPAQAALFDQE
ncbi:MAG: DUF72 domain-containing protein [Armatimonadota bacterium]|nr:DUF72 domain-containing protein [Armatimonadota bacterium]